MNKKEINSKMPTSIKLAMITAFIGFLIVTIFAYSGHMFRQFIVVSLFYFFMILGLIYLRLKNILEYLYTHNGNAHPSVGNTETKSER